jgi:rsbT co-antagonist protein RsbR
LCAICQGKGVNKYSNDSSGEMVNKMMQELDAQKESSKARKVQEVELATNLMEVMGIDKQEIERRKEWLEFTSEDEQYLTEINEIVNSSAEKVMKGLNLHFMKFNEFKEILQNPEILNRIKILQKEYFLRLTKGNYNSSYVEERLAVGSVHANIGLDVKWYLSAYNYYLQSMGEQFFKAFKKDAPKKAQNAFFSLMKLGFMDIGLAVDTYIYQRETTIRQQQDAIRELSTPVFQLRDELLILPIVGVIDAQRARQITERLLIFIRDRRATVVVIDITGVSTVDSRVAIHLLQTVDASRLMGATVIVTGLSSEIAQTLVTIGVDLSRLNTFGDLQGGIAEADRILGYKTTKTA